MQNKISTSKNMAFSFVNLISNRSLEDILVLSVFIPYDICQIF